jgi:hypothetical protein
MLPPLHLRGKFCGHFHADPEQMAWLNLDLCPIYGSLRTVASYFLYAAWPKGGTPSQGRPNGVFRTPLFWEGHQIVCHFSATFSDQLAASA